MIGLDTLAALRRSGLEPQSVHIDTDIRCTPKQRANFAELNLWAGKSMWQAAIDPGENIGRVDLRPVQGLLVQVSGVDAKRIAVIAGACEAAGASRVIASTFLKTQRGADLCIELIHQTDTEGVMVYDAVPA